MSEPLFEATTMEILDGPNFAVRALGRGADVEGVEYLHVRDGEGREIATVRRKEYLSPIGKVIGGVLGILGAGASVSKQRVLGLSGEELFTLEITDSGAVVRDPDGRPIALLANESRAGGKIVDLKL